MGRLVQSAVLCTYSEVQLEQVFKKGWPVPQALWNMCLIVWHAEQIVAGDSSLLHICCISVTKNMADIMPAILLMLH